MKEVIFSPSGEAVSDFEAEKYAYRILEQDHLNVSSHLVIDYVRVMIAEGAIAHTDVTFIYDPGHGQPPLKQLANKGGRLVHWPRGFCDQNMDAIERLMKPHAY